MNVCLPLAHPSPIGSERIVSHFGAAKILGVDTRVVLRMIDLGLLTEELTLGGERRVRLANPTSRLMIYERYVSDLPAVLDMEALDHLHRVRKILGIKANHPYPKRVRSSVFKLLNQIQNFSIDEAAALISIEEDGYPELRQYFDLMRGVGTLPFSQNPNGDAKVLCRSLLPRDMSTLPLTCLCAKESGRYDPPPVAIMNRIAGFGAMATGFALYAVLKSGASATDYPVTQALPVLDRVDQLWTVHGQGLALTTANLTAILRRYLNGEIGCEILDLRCPYDVVDEYLRTERFLVARVSTFPAEWRDRLKQKLPPRTDFSRTERDVIRAKIKESKEEERASRKKDARVIKGYLSELIEVAANRRDQVRYVADCVRRAYTDLTQTEQFRDPVLQFDPLDDRGFSTSKIIKLELRVWRANAAAASVLTDLENLPLDEIIRLDRLRAYRATHQKLVDANYPLVEILAPTASGQLPWFLRVLVARATSFPATLPLAVRQDRFALVKNWGLPGYRPARAGFLKFSGANEVVSKYALHTGRIFVPLFEFERAIRYAALFFEGSTQTSRRLHEIFQLDATKLERNDDNDAFTHQVFQKRAARPSRHHPECVDLTILDETALEAVDLDNLQKEHFGLDEMPTVEPDRNYSRKMGPAKFCFSWGGKFLGHTTLFLSLRYLFLGWPKVTAHLVRHAEAEEDAEDEVPVSLVGAGLGQVALSTTEYYMGFEDCEQEAIDEPKLVRRLHTLEGRTRVWRQEEQIDEQS